MSARVAAFDIGAKPMPVSCRAISSERNLLAVPLQGMRGRGAQSRRGGAPLTTPRRAAWPDGRAMVWVDSDCLDGVAHAIRRPFRVDHGHRRDGGAP